MHRTKHLCALHLLAALLTALVLFCAPAAPWAKVHSWTDEQGVMHFSQKPGKKADAAPGTSSGDSAGKKQPSVAPRELPPGKGPVFMWKVDTADSFAYLLGSMHYAEKGFYPLDARIEAAFDQCRVLAVESDVEGNQAAIQSLTMQLGMYPDGDSLDRHISQRTKDKLEELGALNPLFMRLRPWLLAMQLQSQKFLEKGFDPSKGVDRHFLVQAKQKGMQIKEMEDARETLQVFVDISKEDEDTFLYYSLLELDRFDEVVPKLKRHWQAGDAAGMQKLLFYELSRHPEFKNLGKKLFDDRNVKMARKVEEYLKSGKPHFVVVGAGHLVGPMGVPELLEKKGYDVRQIGVE